MQFGFSLEHLLHVALLIAKAIYWACIVVLFLVVVICGVQVKNYKKSGSG